jgi:hypothetical protein
MRGLKLSCVTLCFQVACNPTDNSVLAIVGPQLFRLLSASDKTWRQYGWSKANALNITSVAWLSFDCVIGGTSDGNLLLVDSGKLKAVYKATDLTTINMKLQEPGKGPGCKFPKQYNTTQSVLCMVLLL